MRVVVLAVLLVPIAAGVRPGPFAQALRPTAETIARKIQDRDTGRDSRMTLRMRLTDRRGRVRERALDLLTLRGRGTPGAGAAAADGDRLLLRFSYPNDIRGTSFLVWEHPEAEDERFLYLPSLGRVRRIAGSETQDSFAGSDFTYEDIGGRELNDYTYAFSGSDGENASWTAPSGGPARPAWRIESKSKDQSGRFPRVVSLVLKDALVVVQAEIYNRRNERQKVYSVRRLEAVESIWTVLDSEMSDAAGKTSTGLIVEQADYNVGLTETDFSRRELERGGRSSGG
jgi:hypothetical protein